MVEEYTVLPEEEYPPPPFEDVTDNDRLLAALSYPIPVVALVILLAEDLKARTFLKYHGVQALAANIALWVVIIVLGWILGILSFLIGGLCGMLSILLWFVTLYWAYKAYQGNYFEIRWLTQFLKDQNWL
jgi:uncharacterized membrane protein